MKNRKVIYTCISGDYDVLNEPIVINKQWDYICFTDGDIRSKHWTIKKIPDDCKYDVDESTGEQIVLSHAKIARKIKINSHEYLSNYDISIWVDGNLEMKSDPEFILDFYGKGDYSVAAHPVRSCIYEEITQVLNEKKDNNKTLAGMWNKYEEVEKVPKKLGMVQTGVIIRNNRNPKVCRLNSEWWKMVRDYSHRDQLSFNYVIWKQKELSDIVYLFSSRIFINEFNLYIHNSSPKKIPDIFDANYGKNINFINGKIMFDSIELTERDILQYKKILIEKLMKDVGESQMKREEYEYISNFMGNKNVLIFGTGRDSNFWRFCNSDGKTIFLENDDAWIDKKKKDIIKVNYNCSMRNSKKLLQEIKEGNYSNLKMVLPTDILTTQWDVIFVDSPCGYDDNCPGRMQSIFTALELANHDTHIFVHDCNREVENSYTLELFEMEVQLTKLRHLKRSKVKYIDV